MLFLELILHYTATVPVPECEADVKCCRYWTKRVFYEYAVLALTVIRSNSDSALAVQAQLRRFSTLSKARKKSLCRAYLMAAARQGNPQVLELLMGDAEKSLCLKGWNDHKDCPPLEHLNQNDDDLKRAILEAAKHNQVECLRFLCTRSRSWWMVTGNKLGVRGRGLQRALLSAVYAGHRQTIRYLVLEQNCFLSDACKAKEDKYYQQAVRQKAEEEDLLRRKKQEDDDRSATALHVLPSTRPLFPASDLFKMDAASLMLCSNPQKSLFYSQYI